MSASPINPTVKINLQANVEEFIKSTRDQISKIKGLGLDKVFNTELKDIESGLNTLSKNIKDVANSKVSSDAFDDVIKQVNDVIQRVSALETSFEEIKAFLANGNFAKSALGQITTQFNHAAESAEKMAKATKEAVDAQKELAQASAPVSASASEKTSSQQTNDVNKRIESLKKEKQLLNEISDAYKTPVAVDGHSVDSNATLTEKQRIELIKKRIELIQQLVPAYRAAQEAADSAIDSFGEGSEEDYKAQKEVLSVASQIRAAFEEIESVQTNSLKKVGLDTIEHFGEIKGIGQTFDDLYEDVKYDCDQIDAVVSDKLESVVQELETLQAKAKETAKVVKEVTETPVVQEAPVTKKKTSSKNDGELKVESVVVPIQLNKEQVEGFKETVKSIIRNLREDINADGGLKIDLAFQTDWGRRKQREAMDELSNALLSTGKNVTEKRLKKLLDQTQEAFADNAKLHFTTDFDDVEKKIADSLVKLKEKAKIHVDPIFDFSAAGKAEMLANLQTQLDEVAKDLQLNIPGITIQANKASFNKAYDEMAKNDPSGLAELTRQIVGEAQEKKNDNFRKHLDELQRYINGGSLSLSANPANKKSQEYLDSILDDLYRMPRQFENATEAAQEFDEAFDRYLEIYQELSKTKAGGRKERALFSELTSLRERFPELKGVKEMSQYEGVMNKFMASLQPENFPDPNDLARTETGIDGLVNAVYGFNQIRPTGFQEVKEEVKETATSVNQDIEKLESGFQKLKDLIAKKGDFKLSGEGSKGNKEDLSKYVDQFMKYQNLGGQRPISDLTDNQKVLEKLTKEYERQKQTVEATTETVQEQSTTLEKTQQEELEAVGKVSNGYTEYAENVGKAESAVVQFLGTLEKQIQAYRDVAAAAQAAGQTQVSRASELNDVPSKILDLKTGREKLVAKTAKSKQEEQVAQVTADTANKAEENLKKTQDLLQKFDKKKEAFANINERFVQTSKEAVEAMENEVPHIAEVSEAFGKAAENAKEYVGALKDIPDSLKRAAIKENSAKELKKKTEPISHNYLRPFISNNTDSYKFVVKEAEKYRDILGDIAQITRNVKADKETFDVLGFNGNHIQLAKDSAGKWTMSQQTLKDNQKAQDDEIIALQNYLREKQKEYEYEDAIEKARVQRREAFQRQGEQLYQTQLRERQENDEIALRNYLRDKQKDYDDEDALEAAQLERRRAWQEEGERLYKEQEKQRQAHDEAILQNALRDMELRAEDDPEVKLIQQRTEYYENAVKATIKANQDLAREQKKSQSDFLGQKDKLNKLNPEEYSNEVAEIVRSLQKEVNSIDLTSATTEQLDELVKKIRTSFQEIITTSSKLENPEKITQLYRSMAEYLERNPALSPEAKAQIREMMKDIESGATSAKGEVKQLSSQFNMLAGAEANAGRQGNNLFSSILKQAKSANAQFFAMYFSIYDWIRYARQAGEEVIKIDSALTELRKVSDASTERLTESFEKSAKTAQELGQNIQHVINVTSDWARLGKGIDEAEELARITAMFTTVGDNMSADDASSYLISTLQGFQIASSQAEDIIDKYNEVANNFAIDTRGIGEALQRSAASFNAAHTDLSESIALITATNEVLQDPESVGTLWKTMSARLRGAKTELKELNEEEDSFTKSTSKLRDLVKSLTGFDIMEDEKTFKSIYEIMVGIGKEWDKLTDVERASLGEALAGKRNANGLYAVLGNLDTLQDAYKAAEESAGSAQKEQENYAKSVKYSIDRAKASIEELTVDFMDSQLLKGGAEFFNGLIKALDGIVEHSNFATVALTALAGALAFKNRKEIINYFITLGEKLAHMGKMAQSLGVVSKDLTPVLAGVVAQIKSMTAASIKFIFTPIGAVIAGITAVVGGAIAAFAIYNHNLEKLREKTVEATEAFEDESSSIDNALAKYKELSDKLKDSNLTEEETFQIKQDLAELQDELNSKYDAEFEKVNLVTGAYEDQKKVLEDISKEKAHQFVVDNNAGYEDAQNVLNSKIKNSGPSLKTKNSKEYEELYNWILRYGNDKGISWDIGNFQTIKLDFDIDAKDAKETLDQFRYDMDEYAKEHGIDVSDYVKEIQKWEDKNIDTETIDNAQKTVDAITKAQIIWDQQNQDLSDTYNKSIAAVKAYNEALASGEGIEKAEEDIRRLKQEVNGLTFDDANVEKVMKGVFDDIDTEAETAHKVEVLLDPHFSDNHTVSKRLEDMIASDQAKIEELGYQVGDAIFGNVNLNEDRVLEWTEENLNKFRDALMSYAEDDTTWEDVKDSFEGTASTVFATSGEWDGIQLAVTPMFREPGTGKMSMLSSDALDDYLHNVIKKAAQNGGLSDKNILKFDNLGIIAGIGEEAETVGSIMHYLGKDGAIAMGIRELKAEQEGLNDPIMQYIHTLSDLDSIDLSAGFEGLNEEQQNAFKGLMEYCGLAEGEEEALISVLENLKNKYRDVADTAEDTNADIVTASEDIVNQLKPQFDALGAAYNAIFNGDKGFDLSVVDADMIHSLTENFTELGKNLKVPFTKGQEAVNKFVDVLTSAETKSMSLADQQKTVQSAFNELATTYFYSADGLQNLNKETADSIEQQLKQLGIVNSGEIVKYYLDLAEKEQLAADNGVYLEEATGDEITALALEGKIAPETAKQLALLALKKQLAAGINFSESGNINQILTLAKAAGIGAKYLGLLARAKSLQAAIDNGASSSDVYKQLADVQKQIDEYDLEADVEVNFDFTNLGKSSSKAGKDSADAYVKAYEEEVKKLDTLKDRGLISEREYLNRLKALNEKYFKDNAKYAEKWAEVAAEYGQKLLAYYNNVISGVTTLLSHRISALQKQKDAAIKAITDERDAVLKALNDEKEAAEEAYKSKMDALQKQIDNYNDEIKAIQKQQKAIEKIIKAKQKEIKAIEKANKVKEKEKKAEEKFIKEQQKIIKANQKEIDALNKQIEPLQEQIDAINKVNEARKESIELQKSEYNLQKMMNQRSKLVYTGEQGQMRYETDAVGVRDAREDLYDKKEQAKVSTLQKKIDALQDEVKSYNKIIDQYQEIIDAHQEIIDGIDEYLEKQQELIDEINEYIESQQEIIDSYQEQIDLIQEKVDALQEQKDAIQKVYDAEMEMYDKRIKAAEKMYDQLEKEANEYWDALLNKLEETKSKWEELAEVEAVAKAWNLVADEMAQFGYTVNDVLNDVPGAFDKFKDAYINALNNMNTGSDQWGKSVAYAADQAEKSYQKATDASKSATEQVDALKEASAGLQTSAKHVDGFAKSVGGAKNAAWELKSVSTGMAKDFEELANQRENVDLLRDSIIGVRDVIDDGSEEGNSLTSSLIRAKNAADVNIGVSKDEESGTVIGNFNQLGAAVLGVSETKVGLTEAEADDGTLIGAVVGLHEKADEHIGIQAGEDGETIIGDFHQLGAEIDNVSADHVGQKGNSSDDETLVGSIKAVSEETTEDVAGTATDDFETFKQKVSEATAEVGTLQEAIDGLVAGSPYKVTIEVETVGDMPSFEHYAARNKGPMMYTGSANTGFAHVEGTAKLSGDWGVQQGGKSLVGELGQELLVRNGRFKTIGDNGPEFINLQPGDIIFNHLQTKQLLDKKNLVMPGSIKGKAFASGSAYSAISSSSSIKGVQGKLQGLIGKVVPQFDGFAQMMEKQTVAMKQSIDKISQRLGHDAKPSVTVNNPSFNVNGVTGEEVMRKIEGQFEGLMLSAYQKAMK